MADDQWETFRLSFMQDILPVGIAVVERVQKGGLGKVVEAFNESKEPLQILRNEGEPVAKNVRDQLDQVVPGLGNPVVSVTVDVEDSQQSQIPEILNQESLMECLTRIQDDLQALENLVDNSTPTST